MAFPLRLSHLLGSTARWALAVVLACSAGVVPARAQAPRTPPSRSAILAAARSIMTAARYTTFVTVGTDGHPEARIVDPRTPDSTFIVYVGTNARTRKVTEVRANPRVTLLYFNAKTQEFVTLIGTAVIVEHPADRAAHWDAKWTPFYPQGAGDSSFTLIRVTPLRLEVVSPKRHIDNDAVTWRPVTVPMDTMVHTPSPAVTSSKTPSPAPVPAPAAQNPSPMQEHARRHERLVQRTEDGVHVTIDGVLPKPLDLFIPQRLMGVSSAPLVLHFMGATWVPQAAAAQMPSPVIMAATYLGGGSAVYARPFAADSTLYRRLIDTLRTRLAAIPNAPTIASITLSGWSAGYGAIREILRHPDNLPLVDGALLLDGMHTSYQPEGKPLADGGVLDTAGLAPFRAFAARAIAGEKRFVVVHSEIFPGTFASTTECTDWLLQSLGISRTPVLVWGPMGTQQISAASRGRFAVLGFAGNTAPDHVDLFHGMGPLLEPLVSRE